MKSTGILLEQLDQNDAIVFFAILFLTAAVTWWGNRRKKNISNEHTLLEFMLMGRELTLPLFVMTMVASWYGGIFGVTEISFESGVYNFLTQGIFWYAVYIIFAFWLAPKLSASGAVTLPELAGKMFGPASQKISGIFNLFNILPVSYVISVGLFLKIIFGGDLFLMMILGTVIMTFYSMWGGFRAVVFSDIVQFFVMCSSVFIVVVMADSQYGGFDFLKQNLPASHFEPMGGNSLATTLVWGFIALATLVDPNFYQRCFAAKSATVARRGILISTGVWIVFDIFTTLGGLYARAVMPEAKPSEAYLHFALNVLPSGVRGFFLAGVLATILSTLDAFLFIASNTLSFDLAPKKWKEKIWYSHLCSIVVGVMAIGIAQFFEGSVKMVWKTLGSYAAGCLLIPMMIGFLRPCWIRDREFVVATLCGAVAITFWNIIGKSEFWQNVDSLYIGMLVTFVSMIVMKIFFRMRTP